MFTSTPAVADDGISSSSTSVTQSQSSIVTTKQNFPEYDGVSLGGIKRSMAFHDGELLQEQVR